MRRRILAIGLALFLFLILTASPVRADEVRELPTVTDGAEADIGADAEEFASASDAIVIEDDDADVTDDLFLPPRDVEADLAEDAADEAEMEDIAVAMEDAPLPLEAADDEAESPETPDPSDPSNDPDAQPTDPSVDPAGSTDDPSDPTTEQPSDQPTAPPEDLPPEPGPDDVVLTSLTLTKSVKLGAGEKYTLTLKTAPANTTEKVTLTSDNPAIAKVSQAGRITAVSAGTTYINATSTFGSTARCKVVVRKAPRKLKLKAGSASICNTFTYQLSVRFYPSDAYSRTLRYTSSNKSVAKVNSKGKITAVGRGTAVITVKAFNGKTARFTARVYNDPIKQLRAKPKNSLGIIFMDISRNDGILLSCGGEYAFIDSGSKDCGARARDYMKRLGVKQLKYYIGTHAHADHVAGAARILAAIPTKQVIVPHSGVVSAIKHNASSYAEKRAVARVKYKVLKYGQAISLGKAKLRCVGPVKVVHASATSTKENQNSLVLYVYLGSKKILLTGDANKEELTEIWQKNRKALKVDVLKNPHHNGNLKGLYHLFGMKYTVISTSSYAQPSSEMLHVLKQLKNTIYNTASNRNSHTLMITNGKTIKFYPSK